MGLEALSCVIPGQIVAASREPDPEPSHREPLRGDISGLFPFLNFFSQRVTEKLFGGFETTFFADGLNLCRRRPWFNASCRCLKLDRTLRGRAVSTTKLRYFLLQ